MSRFSILCRVCEDNRDLIYAAESGTYTCLDCGEVYYDEDGVYDNEEAGYYRDLYLGSVRAGLVPDPDWDE